MRFFNCENYFKFSNCGFTESDFRQVIYYIDDLPGQMFTLKMFILKKIVSSLIHDC